ncbi:MAG: hypothetical protein OXS30_01395 [Chloroflexota bacterium]|nr:hypothetical protein [Chloroflexota bacterium]
MVSPEDADIVIERKSVVWPPDYLSDHRNMHDLRAMVESRIAHLPGLLSEDIYQLRVHSSSLDKKKQTEIERIAEGIAGTVVARESAARRRKGLSDHLPIPWWFGPVPDWDREETTPKRGLGIYVEGPLLPRPGYDYAKERRRAVDGVSQELAKRIEKASQQLRLYPGRLRMLMLQFVAEPDTPLCDDDFVGSVQAATLPDGIDQVWVADQEFYNADEYEVVWKRLR